MYISECEKRRGPIVLSPRIIKISAGIGELHINIDNLYAICEVKEIVTPTEEEDNAIIIEPKIRQFSMTPIYDIETGKLVSARIDYQINEFEGTFSETDLILRILLNGEPLERITLLLLNQLQDDKNNGSHGYVPSLGWTIRTYSFQAELVDNEVSVQSTERTQLIVTPESITKAVSWKTLGIEIL